MANTKTNASVGKPKIGGAIWRAPKGTTPPTDTTTELTSFTCLGYVSADGLTNANNKTTQEIKAWGGDTVLVPVTGHTDQFKATFIEALNAEVLKMAHGDSNVSGSGLATGYTVTADGSEDTEHVYVIDMVLRGNVKKRVVIPCGFITEVGDVVYKDDTAIGYPITITGLPDDSEKTHYEYIIQSSGT